MNNARFYSASEGEGERSLRTHGRTFWFATRFLSPELRQEVGSLYAFCRYLDDLVDETHNPKLAASLLNLHHKEIRQGHSSNPIIRSFIALQECREIEMSYVDHLIEGLLKDTGQFQIENEPDLIQYCYRVASTVGLMMCQVFRAPLKASPFAIDLGIAMQLTNIARDVREDSLRGKVYLPSTLVAREVVARGIEGDDQALEQIGLAQRAILELAERYYESAHRGIPFLPFGARSTVSTASRAYRAIGLKLLRDQRRFFFERCSTSILTKVLSSFQAIVETYSKEVIHQQRIAHNTLLHVPVNGYPGVIGKKVGANNPVQHT